MRLFVALNVPTDHWRLDLPETIPGVDARWVVPGQWHVTLQFIGEVDRSDLMRYKNALGSIEAPPAVLHPYGLDVLPRRHAPRVMTIGLDRTESLMTCHRAVRRALSAVGVATEHKDFRPHVTLARMRDADAEAVHRYRTKHARHVAALPSHTAPAVRLYESIQTGDGTTYNEQLTVPLTNS